MFFKEPSAIWIACGILFTIEACQCHIIINVENVGGLKTVLKTFINIIEQFIYGKLTEINTIMWTRYMYYYLFITRLNFDSLVPLHRTQNTKNNCKLLLLINIFPCFHIFITPQYKMDIFYFHIIFSILSLMLFDNSNLSLCCIM